MKKRIQRVFKLLIRFWIIMILTCCVGYIMGMREQFPGSWLNFVLNAFLIKSSYVGSFGLYRLIQYLFYYPEYSLN